MIKKTLCKVGVKGAFFNIMKWRRTRPAGSCVVAAIYKYTQITEILWRKRGCMAALQVREWAPWSLPGQAFIVFLGTLHRGWSSFTMHRFTTGDYLLRTTKDRTLLITSKRRMLQLNGEAAHTPYLGGLVQILGRWRYSVNIYCLSSGWGSFSKSKSHSGQGTMQAWFPTGEPIHGIGSCPPTSLPTGFSQWGLSHISYTWNGFPHLPPRF